jgi:hypothetical protein
MTFSLGLRALALLALVAALTAVIVIPNLAADKQMHQGHTFTTLVALSHA